MVEHLVFWSLQKLNYWFLAQFDYWSLQKSPSSMIEECQIRKLQGLNWTVLANFADWTFLLDKKRRSQSLNFHSEIYNIFRSVTLTTTFEVFNTKKLRFPILVAKTFLVQVLNFACILFQLKTKLVEPKFSVTKFSVSKLSISKVKK